MKTKKILKKLIFSLVLALGLALGTAAVGSFADTWQDPNDNNREYTYTIINTNEARINKVDPKPTGDYTIPSELNGYPVTRFGIPGTGQTGIFTGCSELTSVTIPEGVEYLGMYMFKECSNLTSVSLPQTLKNMSAETFMSCTKLTNINIPSGITQIGNSTFRDCSNLTSITIPSSVTIIGENTFQSCSKLTSIELPNNLTEIKKEAFFGSGLTSVTIPSSVTTIGTGAFKSCPNLLEIIVEEDNPNYSSVDGVLYNKDKTKLIQCPAGKTGTFEIPEGITSIESYAFSGCGKLTKVTIPESVKTIVEYAFTSCVGLTSIMIPEGVTSIGEAAFYYCTGLTSITIPEGITSIKQRTFHKCTSLTSITIPEGVTSIGKWAFKECSSLTSIILPSTFSSWGQETLLDTDLQAAFFDENATTNTFPTNVGLTNPGSVNRWLYEVLPPASAAPDNKTHVKISGHPGGSATSIKDSAMGDNFVIDDIISSVTLNHDLPSTPDPAVEATCTEPGHIEGYTCKGCGRHFSDVAATTEISEENWITATATGHIEPLEHHTAVAATCTTDGNSEYWYCSQCGKYFNDADGENEIEEGSWVTPAGHSLTAHPAADATCTEPGNSAYWSCNGCGKYFSDATAGTEITEDSWITATAIGHIEPLEHHAAVAATCTEAGIMEYWYCSRCEKYFSDAEGENEIAENEQVIAATGHDWGEISYTWAEDNTTCTAKRVCENDVEHVETETVNTTSAITTPATCTTVGTTTYIATFENEAFEKQTTTETISELGHSLPLSEEERVEPNCTEPGHVAGYTCSVCGKHFGDENGTTEIAEDSWIIPATHTWSDKWSTGDGKHWHECTICHNAKTDEAEHDLVHEESQDPTNEADGHAAGYTCSVCRKHFSDAEGTQEITNEEWIIPKNDGIIGDVNGDGVVTSMDMQMVYNIIIGKLEGDDAVRQRADVNEDGVVTSMDMQMVYNIIIGKLNI